MTHDAVLAAFLSALSSLAPEADLERLPGSADIRERLDIDSFGMLNLMIAIEKKLGVTVPEKDYRKLITVDAAVAYLEKRLATTAAPAPAP